MIVDAAQNTVDASKVELAKNAPKAENVVGNPTASFGQPHEFSQAMYHIPHGARKKISMAQ
jgi:hypothetical protein